MSVDAQGSRRAYGSTIRPREAVRYYLTIFKNSNVLRLSRYGKAGQEAHHRPEGSVLAIAFELDGQSFTALNGGPQFKFNEAISLQVYCESQEEIDYYWKKLSEGGDDKAQQCGWLKEQIRRFVASGSDGPAGIGRRPHVR